MAGDWIKMRTNLWDDPRVCAICDLIDASEATVVGALYRLWSIADEHSEDGTLPALTAASINRKVGVNGFAEAVESVGWLAIEAGNVVIPRFQEHNGKSAKRRSLDARRKSNSASHAEELRKECGRNAEEERKECGARPRERPRERPKPKVEEPNGSSPPTPPKGGRTAPKFDPLAVEIPPALDSGDFREAWVEWVSHRREIRKPLTERSVSMQFAKLAAYGPSGAAAAIRNAIAQGYTGVYPESRGHPQRANGTSATISSYLEQFGDLE